MSQSNLSTRDSDNHTTERGVPVSRIRIDDLPVAENLTPEQEELIQGAGLKPFRPSIEALEAREMLATNVLATGITVTDGVMKIMSTPASTMGQYQSLNQDVRVVMNAGQVQLQRPSAFTPPIRVNEVITRIEYHGGANINDSFGNYTNIPSTFVNQERADRYINYPLHSDFLLTSTFSNGGRLPDSSANPEARRNGLSIGGNNELPPLEWSGAPAETQSWAMVGKDVTVPSSISPSNRFIHQIFYNIPKGAKDLSGILTDGSTVRAVDNGGPNPPDGVAHTYVYTVYALRTANLEVRPGASPEEIERAIRAQSIGQAQISGTLRADVREGWNTETNAWN